MTNLQTSIETITPEMAAEFLTNNFINNRDIKPTAVKRFASMIKRGDWQISCDAIGFDEHGNLINGQHRMSAVVKANQSADFLVVRGFPAKAMAVLDQGNKRMMHERLRIKGIPINGKTCSCVRNAMTTWSSKNVGTVQFSDLRHDDLVSYEYQKHCLFWALLHEIGYMTNSIPTYFNVGAFEIFRKICDLDFGMEHAALLRALQFIETVETGGLEFYGVYNTKTDGAARALRERYLQHKAKGRHWATWDCYAVTMNAARHFAANEAPRALVTPTVNPFVGHSKTSTNQKLLKAVAEFCADETTDLDLHQKMSRFLQTHSTFPEQQRVDAPLHAVL